MRLNLSIAIFVRIFKVATIDVIKDSYNSTHEEEVEGGRGRIAAPNLNPRQANVSPELIISH